AQPAGARRRFACSPRPAGSRRRRGEGTRTAGARADALADDRPGVARALRDEWHPVVVLRRARLAAGERGTRRWRSEERRAGERRTRDRLDRSWRSASREL